jgi:N-acetylneuraminic acid mutarotase
MKKLFFTLTFCVSLFAYNQTWETAASLPASAGVRHHPITFSVGGLGYLVGGATPTILNLGDFYSYNPDTDSWTTLPDFPGLSRGYTQGIASDTKGYVGFGFHYDEVTFEEYFLNDLWEFDPVTGDWTELAPFPGAARYHPAIVYLDNKIYVGVGQNDLGDLKDWWVYDISANTWTEKTEFPASERHHPFYFAIGEYVYVGFGHHATEIYNDFYRYDPVTDTWTTMASLPEQGRVAGTQFSYNGNGYILSGQGETHINLPTGEFWEYNPLTDSWLELTAHPGGGRWAPGSFMIDSKVYLTCGQANEGETKDMIVYDFDLSAGLAATTAPSIQVYPNPSHGIITLQGDFKAYTTIEIIDASGKVLLQVAPTNQPIDVRHLSAGMYYLSFVGTDVRTEKLILE